MLDAVNAHDAVEFPVVKGQRSVHIGDLEPRIARLVSPNDIGGMDLDTAVHEAL